MFESENRKSSNQNRKRENWGWNQNGSNTSNKKNRDSTTLDWSSGKQVFKFNVCAMNFIVLFIGTCIRLFLCLPPFGFVKRGHITMSNDHALQLLPSLTTKPNLSCLSEGASSKQLLAWVQITRTHKTQALKLRSFCNHSTISSSAASSTLSCNTSNSILLTSHKLRIQV